MTLSRGAERGGSAGRCRRGITLLELMVVLAIISTLMGMAMAGFTLWKRRSMYDACMTGVALVLREARNYAISAGLGSVVEVDTARSVMFAWSYRPVELLTFDSPGGSRYTPRGDVRPGPGRLGRGVDLAGDGVVALPDAGNYLGREGMAFRAFVLLKEAPRAATSAATLMAAGDVLALEVTPECGLRVRMGPHTAASRGMVLVPGRWHEVTCQWIVLSRLMELTVTVDGVDVALRAAQGDDRAAEFEMPREPFASGVCFGPLPALLDEVQLFTALAGGEFAPPGEYALAGPPLRVHFAPTGGLDMRYHDAPAEILVVPSELLEETRVRGRTVVGSATAVDDVPPEHVSRVRVEFSGRIWGERGEARPEAEAAAAPGAGGGGIPHATKMPRTE